MMNESSMDRMLVDKSKLLETVKTNLEKYNVLYKASVDSYWKIAENKLTKMLERVKTKRKIDYSIGINFPSNHEEDYKLVIKMLEFSKDEVIVLTPQEFSKYVMNNWSWRNEFICTTRVYAMGVCGTSGSSGASGVSGTTGGYNDDGDEVDEETYNLLQKLKDF